MAVSRAGELYSMPDGCGCRDYPMKSISQVLFFSTVRLLVSAGCHKARNIPSGAVGRTLSFAGEIRTYVLYASHPKPKPALVLVLRGKRGNGARMEERTRRTFDTLADHEGIVVVYPDALDGVWNSGHPGDGSEDDAGFLFALIDAVSKEFDIDPKRVFATGISNGAAMAYRLACERPNVLAAIAPVSGASRRRSCLAVPMGARCPSS